MEDRLHIQPISAEKTHIIRHQILRKGRPLSDCVFKGDELPTTYHLEAIKNREQVGVLSAFKNPHPHFNFQNSYQIRGVAVAHHVQGEGIGKQLMLAIEEFLKEKKVSFIWLNARKNAVPFYQSINYSSHGEPFDIPQIGIHYCYFKHV